jgi:hypothetical protein
LSDPFFEAPYAMHFGVGVQRELAADLVVSADFAWRRFLHSLLLESTTTASTGNRPDRSSLDAQDSEQRLDGRLLHGADYI